MHVKAEGQGLERSKNRIQNRVDHQFEHSFNQQAGNSLLELILSLGVMAVISMSVVIMNSKAQSQEKGRLASDAIQSFTQLAAQYFIANRSALESVMSGAADPSLAPGSCAINITSSNTSGVPTANPSQHTCTIDATLLQAKGLWPLSMPINQGSHRYVAIFHQLPSADASSSADEVLVLVAEVQNGVIKTQGSAVYTAPLTEFVEQTAASLASLGAQGGFIPPGKDFGTCRYNTQIKEACGQGWKVNLADFL